MLPMSVCAASRGSCVSVSRVMTYLIDPRTDRSPTMSENAESAPPAIPVDAGLSRPGLQQKRVELLELAPLAFVAHPDPLVRIPHPRAVEQIEDAGAIVAVRVVERLDAGAGKVDQVVVARLGALGSIAEVREQSKEQVGITIAEIAYLQGFQKIGDVLFASRARWGRPPSSGDPPVCRRRSPVGAASVGAR